MRAMQELNTLKAATTDNGLHSNGLHDDGLHDGGLNNGDALGGGQGARRASASAPSHERGRMGGGMGGMGGMGGGAGGGAGGGGGGMGGAREQQQQREAAAETARLRVALSTAQQQHEVDRQRWEADSEDAVAHSKASVAKVVQVCK